MMFHGLNTKVFRYTRNGNLTAFDNGREWKGIDFGVMDELF